MKTAVAFLVNKPFDNTINFAKELKEKSDFDVFIVIDDNEKKYEYDTLNVCQIDDNNCGYYKNSATYEGKTNLKKNPNSWDKMFKLFCTEKEYDFLWVFEEDVFIPNAETIINLHNKYKHYDLVTPNNFHKKDSLKDWHWSYILDTYDAPFYYSMVCAFGMSKNLSKLIGQFVDKNKTLYYHEIMLNTIAMQGGLKVKDAFELKSVVWMGKWDIDEFLLLPNNVFHPIKEIDKHHILRDRIQVAKNEQYTPVNNLPDFINNLI